MQDAANYVSETIQGGGATASKEANKEVAKDSNASVGTRLSAAKDAVSDKMDEQKHESKAEINEQKVSSAATSRHLDLPLMHRSFFSSRTKPLDTSS